MIPYSKLLSISWVISIWTSAVVFAEDQEPTAPPVPIRFSEHLIDDYYSYAYGLAVADLDGDGDLDLTSPDIRRESVSDMSWFENNGHGQFSRQVIPDNEPGWFERHAVGDIDQDGTPDVVVVDNQGGRILWLANPGGKLRGSWQRRLVTTNLPRAYDVALADLDNDGDLDIAASGYATAVFRWYENPGDGGWDKAWTSRQIDDNMPDARTIRVGDFNRDGRPDLLGSAARPPQDGPHRGPLVWYANSGDPTNPSWQRHEIENRPVYPIHGSPVDLDQDGDLDVLMAFGLTTLFADDLQTHEVAWYEQAQDPADPNGWVRHTIGKLPAAFEAVAADLDGDGDLDVAATAWQKGHGKVVWFENHGNPRGGWTQHLLKNNWDSANQLVIADLNGDGRLDIVAVADDGYQSNAITNELRWWRNEGNATR